MPITNSGKDFLYSEWPTSTHIKHSAVASTVTLASTGTTALSLTQPSPAFYVGEQVQLRDATKKARAIVTASGVGSVTIQPYYGTGDSGSPAGQSFTTPTLESVAETPTRAATLTIDLRDAPAGTSYTYLILGTANISQSSATNVSQAWLRSQATPTDPYAGTANIGAVRVTHTGNSTHNFTAARRDTLTAGSQYVYTVEVAADDTAGGTTTAQYAALCALRYTTGYTVSTANGEGNEQTISTSTFGTAFTLGSNALAAGTYLIVATGAVGTSNVTDDSCVRLVTNSAATAVISDGRFKMDAATDYVPFSFVGLKTVTGTNEVRLQFARSGTTSTVKLKNAQLCAIALPAWVSNTASSDFTGQTASITTATGLFNLLQASGNVSLSQGFHLEVVSAAVAATTAGTNFGPLWNDPGVIFGLRGQGLAYAQTQTYATAWIKGRSRSAGTTSNWLLATPTTVNTSVASNPQFYWLRQATFPDPGVESKPASAALGNVNFLRTASLSSATSQATNYPARYLLADHRTRRWRSTDSGTAQQIVFDLGSDRLPTMLGLVDYNGTTGTIKLESSTSTAFTSNLQTYSFSTPTQSSNAKTFCFYPATDNWGATPVARQFWRLTLPAGATTDAYHELGNVWLGTYEPFDVVSSLSVQANDESPVAESRAGARYVDQFRPSASVSLSVEYLALASAQALRDRLAGIRQDPVLLDVHAISTASSLYPYGRFYGYLEPGGISSDLKGGNENTVSISFVEARG
jgi:hypothetical protein